MKTKIVYVTLFLLISLFAPALSLLPAGSVLAAPVVQQASGTLDHKSTVTLTGSAFGSKPTAAPLVWDDASGTNILDKWDGAWPDNNPTYNTTYRSPIRGIPLPHSHDSMYIAGGQGDNLGANLGYSVLVYKNLPSVAFPFYVYASWYQQWDPQWVFFSDGTDNQKTFAYSVCCGPYQMPNNWYLGYNFPFSSATSSGQWNINDDGNSLQNPDQNGHNHWWAMATNPFSSQWIKNEVALKLTDQTDGYVKLWEDGVLKMDYAGSTDKYGGNARTVGIGGYARPYGQPNNWRYFSDVYVDTALARVVLANNQTLSQATIIEPQIPTGWSDSSISFTVNLGKFTAGQTAYLFVVDPSGDSNAVGLPVTVGGTGGSGGTTPPPSSGGGGDTSSSGGSGCGFVKNDGKGQKAKGEGLPFAMMLIIALTGIALVRKAAIYKGGKGVEHIKRMTYLSLFFFVIFCIPVFANAADYYVATNGNDSNPGTEAQPWQHIAWATCGGSYLCPISTNNPNKLKAGDTLYIRGGTYNEYNIRFANSGALGNLITMKSYPSETAIIDGGFTTGSGLSWGAVIFIDNNNYITLDGLTIKRGLRANVRIGYDYNPTNITIKNCDISDFVASDNSGEITIVHGGNIVIENNLLHGYQPYALDTSNSLNAAGVHIFYAGDVTIRNNIIYNTQGGIYYKGSWDNGSTTIIENNSIYNQDRWGIMSAKRGTIIRNNIIRNVTHGPGIQVFEESSSCDNLVSSDNQIIHNTIADIYIGIFLTRSTSCPGAVNTMVKDNLIYNFTSSGLRGLSVWPYYSVDTSNTTFDHNLIYSSSFSSPIRVLSNYYTITTIPSTVTGTGNIQQAPIFTDYANKNFTLQPNSPGYKAASDGYDMGADTSLPPIPTPDGGGNTPPPSSGSGGDSGGVSGGGGCGFVKNDDGKGQGAKGEGLSLMIMLIITLTGIALAKRIRT